MDGFNQQFLAEGKDDIFMEIADQFRTEGFTEGMAKGLKEGIELGLDLRFGDSARSMLTTIENIHDIKKLQIIKDSIRRVENCDEFNDILKQL